jgi:hypothetical protein
MKCTPNSPNFVRWLSEMTALPALLAGPGLDGGGLHQANRGGFLNVHTDFSHHHYHENWRWRLNLILYLKDGWRPEWGGAIERWDARMRSCVMKYPPLIHHTLIFNTDERSFHGFPEPLACPENVSRKKLGVVLLRCRKGSLARPPLDKLPRAAGRRASQIRPDLARQTGSSPLFQGQGPIRVLRRLSEPYTGPLFEESGTERP